MVNCILTAMLAKTTEGIGIGTSRMSCLHTGLANRNPPFFLLYGHDPRLPTPAALSPAKVETNLDFKAYGADLVTWMSTAWKTDSVKKVQKWQKKYYDKKSRVRLETAFSCISQRSIQEKLSTDMTTNDTHIAQS